MAKTAVADIIIPTEFEKYAIERTAQLSVFVQSGIIEHAPEFDELASGGGRTVEIGPRVVRMQLPSENNPNKSSHVRMCFKVVQRRCRARQKV